MEDYNRVFNEFLTLVILLESVINNSFGFKEVMEDELVNFLEKKCSDHESFQDLAEMINKTEI